MKKIISLSILFASLALVGVGCSGSSSRSGAAISFDNDWFKPGMWRKEKTTSYYQSANGSVSNISERSFTAITFKVGSKSFDGMVINEPSNGGIYLNFWPKDSWLPGQSPKFQMASSFEADGQPVVTCNTASPVTMSFYNPNGYATTLNKEVGDESLNLLNGGTVSAKHFRSGTRDTWITKDVPFFLTKLTSGDYQNQTPGSMFTDVMAYGLSGGNDQFPVDKLATGKDCKF